MTAKDWFRVTRTPATLLILLTVLIVGAWWGYRTVVGPAAVKPVPCTTQTVAELTPAQVSVRVLNGGDIRGYASEISTQLRDRGYSVIATGNTSEPVTEVVVVVGETVDSPDVKLVAAQFANPVIRADGRVDKTVDVLLGVKADVVVLPADYPTSMPVPGGTICVPDSRLSPSPTPS